MMRLLIAALLGLLAHVAPAQQLLMEEVPFVATPDNVTLAMLQLAGVGPEDYLIDLGSGDGRIVIVAASRFGARGLGVEYVAELVQKSRDNARLAGVGSRAFFRKQDLFETDLSPASVITLYLLPEVNLRLRPRILALRPGTRVVSHDWDMGDWPPDKTVVVDVPDKEVGHEKKSRVHLWVVPARVAGLWCGTGKQKGSVLKLEQQYQRFRGELAGAGATMPFEGRIEGATLRSPRNVGLRVDRDRLRVQAIGKPFSPWHGGTFVRTTAGACR